MGETQTHRIWVAYGPVGVVGTVEKSSESEYIVKMARADEPVGTYPSMDVAKNALHSHLKPGSDWPQFREH